MGKPVQGSPKFQGCGLLCAPEQGETEANTDTTQKGKVWLKKVR